MSSKEDWDKFQRECEASAAKKIAEMLTSTDQLNTVATIKANLVKKKAALEAQIKTMGTSQMEEARESINLINESVSLVSSFKADASKIDSLCKECQTLIKEYPIIKQVDTIRNNFLMTLKEVDRLMRVPEKIGKIEALMQDDLNILKVYMEVRALEKMRETAFISAANNMDELRALQITFKDVERITKVFENRLFTLAGDCLQLAQKKPTVLVRTLQVIERECKQDNLLREAFKERGLDPDDELNSKKFRNYRNLFFLSLRDSIFRRFEEMVSSSANVVEILEKSQILIDDLTTVVDDVVCCFPDDYDIFNFFAKEYHIRFNTLMLRYANDPDTVSRDDIIDLVNWVRQTYTPQLLRLGVSEIINQPNLLETLEPLYDAYKIQIKKMMDEWIIRIVAQDLNKDAEVFDGLYITFGSTELFESVNSLINVARGTADTKFVYGTMEVASSALLNYQNTISAVLSSKWETLPLEYILAQINNNNKNFDQTEELVDTVGPNLEEHLRDKLTEMYKPVEDGFTSVAKQAMLVVSDIIFRDLKEPFDKLFTKEWVATELMGSIILTMEDYFHDIQTFIVESFSRKLANECLDRCMCLYLEQLFTKKHTLDKNTHDRMQDDELKLRTFFSKYTKEKIVSEYLQIIVDLRQLIDSEPEMISLYYHAILEKHPDLLLNIVYALLQMRYDLNKSQINDAMQGCINIWEQYQQKHSGDNNNTSSINGIFTKLKLASKLPSYNYKKK